jgi:hypothetical protein
MLGLTLRYRTGWFSLGWFSLGWFSLGLTLRYRIGQRRRLPSDNRPQEGPGETPEWRVRVIGQGEVLLMCC